MVRDSKRKQRQMRSVTLRVTREEAILLAEAIDSHVYWQLSGEKYRHDATVVGQGSDDPEQRAEIRLAAALHESIACSLGEPLEPPIGPGLDGLSYLNKKPV